MMYYLKKLGHQELGSVENGKAKRGRYILTSKDPKVVDFFPHLTKIVLNDSALLPIIPLYLKDKIKVYCNYVYHNSKHNTPGKERNGRDEYRIYSNNALEKNRLLFKEGDILVFRALEASEMNGNNSDDSEWGYDNNEKLYILDLVTPKASNYKELNKIIESSKLRGGHAVINGTIKSTEAKITKLLETDIDEIDTLIDDTVTAKAQVGDIDSMASLFNAISFRDFVMNGYEYKCAITGTVIRYKTFMNLEAAHIQPRSHQGLYLPSNGIALCRDMHWAFDKGIITIDDDYLVRVHPKINSEYLREFDKKQIFIPKNEFFRPDINNLHYHQQNVYGLFLHSGSLMKANGYVGNN